MTKAPIFHEHLHLLIALLKIKKQNEKQLK